MKQPREGIDWAYAAGRGRWGGGGVGVPISPARGAVSDERRLVHPCSADGARLKAPLPVKKAPHCCLDLHFSLLSLGISFQPMEATSQSF